MLISDHNDAFLYNFRPVQDYFSSYETGKSVTGGYGGPRGRVVKVADFSALNHSIISPMWVRASHGARIHM